MVIVTAEVDGDDNILVDYEVCVCGDNIYIVYCDTTYISYIVIQYILSIATTLAGRQ